MKELSRRVMHKGRKFDLEMIEFQGPEGGRPIAREVVRHIGAAVILPILEERGNRSVVLIHNERLAIGRRIWELPAGTLEPGEPPAACAGRELEEETGYAAATLEPLCRFYSSPGMTDEVMHVFVARGLRFVGRRPEPDERMSVEAVPASRALEMIDRAEIEDGKTIASLLTAARRGLLI